MYQEHYRGLEVEVLDGGVAQVTIVGRNAHNALSLSDHEELASVWGRLGEDERVRAILVTGRGEVFSAGGDLADELAHVGDHAYAAKSMDIARRLVYGIVDCPKPVVSAINGAAVGAGLAVALLADISVAGHDVVIADGHVRIGLTAGDHAALIWPLLCGLARAKRYLLTGDRMDGRTAADIGLISESVPNKEVLPRGMDLARRLAAGPTGAIQGTKRALNLWLHANASAFEASLADEMRLMGGQDFAEGVSAFLERRRPDFQ